MNHDDDLQRFEFLVLPHLDAAYNLARWLTRNDQDAQDVVQEAFLRALRYFDGFRGDEVRPWLLQIVRHSSYTWLKANRPAEVRPLDEDDEWLETAAPASSEPHSVAMRNADKVQINLALAALPIVYREVLVLRELEDMPYKDIARVADIPIGTVMSRLARARRLMRQSLSLGSRPPLRVVTPVHQKGAK